MSESEILKPTVNPETTQAYVIVCEVHVGRPLYLSEPNNRWLFEREHAQATRYPSLRDAHLAISSPRGETTTRR